MSGGLVCVHELYTRESYTRARICTGTRIQPTNITGPIDRPCKRKCDTRERCAHLLASKPGLQFLIVYMRGHCPDAAYLTHIPDISHHQPSPPPPPLPFTAAPPSITARRGSYGSKYYALIGLLFC